MESLAVVCISSVEQWQDEYCHPFKHAERWIAAKKRVYGALCQTGSFARVEQFLFSSRGRPAVLACIKANMRLEGISDQQPGVEQCRALIKELDKMRETPHPAVEEAAAKEEGEVFDEVDTPKNEQEGEERDVLVPVDDEADPVRIAADQKARGRFSGRMRDWAG